MKPSRTPVLVMINATSLAVVAAAAAIALEDNPLDLGSYLFTIVVLLALTIGVAAAVSLRAKREQQAAHEDAATTELGIPVAPPRQPSDRSRFRVPLLIFGTGTAVASLILPTYFLFFQPPQCPRSYTQKMINETGCIVGADLAPGLLFTFALIIWLPCVIAAVAIAFVPREARRSRSRYPDNHDGATR